MAEEKKASLSVIVCSMATADTTKKIEQCAWLQCLAVLEKCSTAFSGFCPAQRRSTDASWYAFGLFLIISGAGADTICDEPDNTRPGR